MPEYNNIVERDDKINHNESVIYETLPEVINNIENNGEYLDLRKDIREEFDAALAALTYDKQELVLAIAHALIEQKFPERAPELYAERKSRKENPAEFIRRVYPHATHSDLPQNQIKRLDPQLYQSLNAWLKRNEAPDDLRIPTIPELYDKLFDRFLANTNNAQIISRRLMSVAAALVQRSPK